MLELSLRHTWNKIRCNNCTEARRIPVHHLCEKKNYQATTSAKYDKRRTAVKQQSLTNPKWWKTRSFSLQYSCQAKQHPDILTPPKMRE